MPVKPSNIKYLKSLISSKSTTKAQQEGVLRDYEQRKIVNLSTAMM